MKIVIEEQRGKFRIKVTEIVKLPEPNTLGMPSFSAGRFAWVIDPMESPMMSGIKDTEDYKEDIKVTGNWFRRTITKTTTITKKAKERFKEEEKILQEEYEYTDADGDTWPNCRDLKFDSYKKAEAYVKELYGTKGVEAIEKPDWKTA